MRKKYSTFFLIALLLGIWGLVFYKMFKYFTSDNDQKTPIEKNAPSIVSEDSDTLTLKMNYADPFTGAVYSKMEEKSGLTRQHKAPRKDTIVKTKTVIDNISYKGEILNKSNNSKVYIVSINGISKVISKERNDSVFIIKDTKELLTINYKGSIKNIKK